MKILGFDAHYYFRNKEEYDESRGKGRYLNIVPLDEMTERERLEIALGDGGHVAMWDSVEAFLADLNDCKVPECPLNYYKCGD